MTSAQADFFHIDMFNVYFNIGITIDKKPQFFVKPDCMFLSTKIDSFHLSVFCLFDYCLLFLSDYHGRLVFDYLLITLVIGFVFVYEQELIRIFGGTKINHFGISLEGIPK